MTVNAGKQGSMYLAHPGGNVEGEEHLVDCGAFYMRCVVCVVWGSLELTVAGHVCGPT